MFTYFFVNHYSEQNYDFLSDLKKKKKENNLLISRNASNEEEVIFFKWGKHTHAQKNFPSYIEILYNE